MDVQELLNRNTFLEDEVHRCYAEIEDYEVKIKEFETKIAGLEKLLNRQRAEIADYEGFFNEIVKRLEEKRDNK
nr:hypothetical protein [Streptococcus lutetiensis]